MNSMMIPAAGPTGQVAPAASDAWQEFRDSVMTVAGQIASASCPIPVVHGEFADVVAATASVIAARAGLLVRVSGRLLSNADHVELDLTYLPADVHVILNPGRLMASDRILKSLQARFKRNNFQRAISPDSYEARVAPHRVAIQREDKDGVGAGLAVASNRLLLVSSTEASEGARAKCLSGPHGGLFQHTPVSLQVLPELGPAAGGAGELRPPRTLLADWRAWRVVEEHAGPVLGRGLYGSLTDVVSPIVRLADLCESHE